LGRSGAFGRGSFGEIPGAKAGVLRSTPARYAFSHFLLAWSNAMAASKGAAGGPVWRRDDGSPVACHEKIKVMNENLAEIRQMAQDAFEDALLMGCSEEQVREVFVAVMRELVNPWPARSA